MQIFNIYLVSVDNLYSFHLPFQNQSELEGVDVVHFLYLNDVNDRHGHIYVDGDVDVVHFVKAERSNLLVVVVLYIQLEGGNKI